MKIESKEITNSTTVKNIIDAVNQYIKDILSTFKNPAVIEITSVKVDIKNNKVYVVYEDYSDVAQKTKELLTEAINIKNQLAEVKDEVKKAVLLVKLGEINEEYKKLTGMEIYEVI